MRRNLCIFAATLAFAMCHGQTPKRSVILNAPVDQNTAVKFYWFGDMWSHWRDPVIFYVADDKNPNLHKIVNNKFVSNDIRAEGLLAYITASEMETLIRKLTDSDLEWVDSSKKENFAELRPITKKGFLVIEAHDWYEITVASSKGSSKADIRIARMCYELKQFDSVMPSSIILWSFQQNRRDNGCEVPGFNAEGPPS